MSFLYDELHSFKNAKQALSWACWHAPIHLHELTGSWQDEGSNQASSQTYRSWSDRAGEQIHGMGIRQGGRAYSSGYHGMEWGFQPARRCIDHCILCTALKPPENLLYINICGFVTAPTLPLQYSKVLLYNMCHMTWAIPSPLVLRSPPCTLTFKICAYINIHHNSI